MEQPVLCLRKPPLPGGIRPIQGENCSGSPNQDTSEILKRLLLSPNCSNAWPLSRPWTDGVDNWPAHGAQRLFLASYNHAATPSASWPCTPPPRRPHLLPQEERRGSFGACNCLECQAPVLQRLPVLQADQPLGMEESHFNPISSLLVEEKGQ